MAVYISKKCPHCGCYYSRNEGKNVQFFGSPFRKCPRCGDTFIDKDYKELAFQEPGNFYQMKIQPFSVAFILFGCLLVGIILGVLGFKESMESPAMWLFPLFFFIEGIYLIIGDIRNYKDRMDDLEAKKRESENRLKDPNYARALQELGYQVPARFLFPNLGQNRKSNNGNISEEPEEISKEFQWAYSGNEKKRKKQ